MRFFLKIEIAIVLTLFISALIVVFLNILIYPNQILKFIQNLITIFAIFVPMTVLVLVGALLEKTEELTNQAEENGEDSSE